ncbi:MAG: energy-coupling factor transporter ATPase [Clostridiales bacterium]|nr:energy-coupling factor transporter ATPase [Clostridiales bacterium]
MGLAIELKNLSHKYSIGTPFEINAVDSVSLKINQGEFVGVIGHTGSGKSTLIQMINGLIKPSEGAVFIDGVNIYDKAVSLRDIRFKVGLVFQYSEHQLFEETVYKDIAFGPKNMGLNDNEVDKKVRYAAKIMGIDDEMLKRSPFDLSGGQMRRVALAGVIAMEPQILILDEPAAGLDPKGRRKVLELIKDYHENSGKTVLLVSHSMEDVVDYATKVLVMNKGRVFCYDDTDKVFSKAQQLQEIGLDIPQISRFALALKKYDVDLGNNIYTVKKAVQGVLNLTTNKEKL